MKSPRFKASVAVASLLFPLAVSATTYNELGDAGQTLATAQAVGAGVDKITGLISGDADLFQFMWGGGSFHVDTVGSNFDTMLFLFSSTGIGILGKDGGDEIGVGTRSYLALSDLAAGSYYIGVSQYDYIPKYSMVGMMFQTPGNPAPLDHWGGDMEGWGKYSINFSQATSGKTSAQEPGQVNVPDGGMTVILLGMGMSGVVWARRKVG